MEMYCGFSRNTTCSYCIANIHREVSCSTLDKHYTQSIGGELDFEQPVSVKVEPCTDILPEDCLDQGEWINFTIPAGGTYSLSYERKYFSFNFTNMIRAVN